MAVDLNTVKSSLLKVENPARYAGAEFFYNRKNPSENDIKCCICFADLYEIGMANNAVKIIYDELNNLDGVYCDRAFSVAPDFEALLKEKDIPLFSLADNIPLKEFDLIGISLGSELAATNCYQIVDLSQISLDKENRAETDPIIIAGGPAVTNPLPFSSLFDFVYIGEAENGYDEVISLVKANKTRTERIEALKRLSFLWYPGKKLAVRAVDNCFTDEEKRFKHFVIPAFKISQDNGNVEIMRGCPNGCRFCHAGQYYKPYRQRSLKTVYNLVKQEVEDFGYREITLASLSSGDYPNLDLLIKGLNKGFSSQKVSFSLPSLKVSTFSLDVLQQISEVRKSGLTFAIETPLISWQHAMNKEVPVEQVISIIKEAKSRGWKSAKFYFMVGLPFVDKDQEEQAIVDFLQKIFNETRINMSINIGTFIPKAHTPFQWVPQMRIEDSDSHLRSIKHHLTNTIKGIKVSYHEPFVSYLEGIVSRGNADTGLLIRKAYEKGARLDAWDDYLQPELWKQAMLELSDYDFEDFIFSEHDLSAELPWDSISMGVSKAYLAQEYNRAKEALLTLRCNPVCDHKCGVCSKVNQITEAVDFEECVEEEIKPDNTGIDVRQVILKYSKKGKAVYLSHINTMRAFEQAFQRCKLPIMFTQGFNPKPREEFLNPLTLGVSGENELAMVELNITGWDENRIITSINNQICEGITINKCYIGKKININDKKYSLAARLKNSVFRISNITDNRILDCLNSFKDEDQIKVVKQINTDKEEFLINVIGDKNILKTIFPDINKFEITGSCDITRLDINIGLDD